MLLEALHQQKKWQAGVHWAKEMHSLGKEMRELPPSSDASSVTDHTDAVLQSVLALCCACKQMGAAGEVHGLLRMSRRTPSEDNYARLMQLYANLRSGII
jgi:hypothetical protein